jgi:hypothetical protein
MRVEGSGGRRVVAPILLNEAQVHPGLEQMGRPGVAQRVHRRALGDATGLQSGPEGLWPTGAGHGLGGGGHARASPTWRWEDPDRVAMGKPVGA